MATRYSTFGKPEGVWWTHLGRDERLWLGFAIIWCLAMFAMMTFIWPMIGLEQNAIESQRIAPTIFRNQVEQFTAANRVGEIDGVPVVAAPPGGDVYLQAQSFAWRPIIQLKRGERYRFLISSVDVQHGFSLQMPSKSINFQVLPGYTTEIVVRPERSGVFPIVCNEYCGLGHHTMIGRIIVTD